MARHKKVARYRVLSVRVTDEEHAACLAAAGKDTLDNWLYYKIFGRGKV